MNLAQAVMMGRRLAPASRQPIVWESPATSSSGQTVYGRNFQSTNLSQAAALVTTSAAVNFVNCRFKSTYPCIWSTTPNSQITVTNCVLECTLPNVLGATRNSCILIGDPLSVTVEYCTLIGGTIQFDAASSSPTNLTVRYNKAINLNGMKSDGYGGEVYEVSNSSTYWTPRQFVQYRNCNSVPAGEIAWNYVVQQPAFGRSEDIINMYNASGTVGRPYPIHDNFLYGCYCSRPTSLNSYSGVHLLVENGSQYLDFDDNHLLSGTLACNVSVGTNIRVRRNRAISTGKVMWGGVLTDIAATNSSAMYGTGATNAFTDNVTSWRGTGGVEVSVDVGGGMANTGEVNLGIPTAEYQAAELGVWQEKCAVAGYFQIGSTLA